MRSRQALGSLEALVGTRRGVLLLAVLAIGVYAVESVGWPAQPGRDLGVYLRYYAQMGPGGTVFPWAMLTRTPVAPVVAGLTLAAGGGFLVDVVMVLMFIGSILAWSAVAWYAAGRRAALLVAVVLLLYPGYGGLFHELSSDSVFAAAFAGFAYLLARAVRRGSVLAYVWAGLGVAVVALTRPANVILVAIAPFVLVFPGTWSDRFRRAAAFTAAAVIPLLAWSGVNDVRYGQFTVARGGQSSLPFFRAFVADKIIAPDNGPASRRLALAVHQQLLPLQPYRAYGITLNEFFTSGSARMEEDLISLSDRVFGWDSNYSVLGRAAREGVRKHSWKFTRGVATSFWQELNQPLFVESIGSGQPRPPGQGPGVTVGTVRHNGRALPKPSEGEPIPASHQGDYVSTPDQHVHEVWRSAVDHGLVFDNPSDQRKYARLNARMGELATRFPARGESAWMNLQLNHASKAYPRAWMWLLLGLIAFLFRRPREWRLPVLLTCAGLLVLLVTVLSVYAVPEYAVPVVPAFIVFAAFGLFAPRTAP
jgi:4-amino-4-deoxy-L-arabinose transferase-like glycosyltransferase